MLTCDARVFAAMLSNPCHIEIILTEVQDGSVSKPVEEEPVKKKKISKKKMARQRLQGGGGFEVPATLVHVHGYDVARLTVPTGAQGGQTLILSVQRPPELIDLTLPAGSSDGDRLCTQTSHGCTQRPCEPGHRVA